MFHSLVVYTVTITNIQKIDQLTIGVDIARRYRGVDKSLARPGRKQATAIEDFDVHVGCSYILKLHRLAEGI